jgi:ribosomal protein L16 Arg81 hydroxylase
MLSRLRVNDNRVGLVKQAKWLDRESYVKSSLSGRVQYLMGSAVAKHVSEGATLVVNQVDELFPAIRELADACEEAFDIYAAANLYAAWRRDNGFDVHWDTHDTLIAQITGRKDWKIWAPTRLHPLAGESREVVPPPSTPPAWEGTLDDGDTLYMPRGWWHVAYPRDEPSLHITIALTHPTGLDVINWAMERVTDSVDVRNDAPHWKDAEAQATWIRALREACAAALTDDVLERYMASAAERAHPRPIVRLPAATIEPGFSTLEASTPLRLARGRRLSLRRQDNADAVTFDVQGTEWRCHKGLAPALKLLHHTRSHTLSELSRVVETKYHPLLSPFIKTLVMADVIWAEPSSEVKEHNAVSRS